MPTQDNREFAELFTEAERDSSISTDFIILTILSSIIASLGLMLNSSAIIIGAMILAPLMSPILGISFSGLIYHHKLLLGSVKTIVVGVLLSCAIGALLGAVFHDVGITDEILARTKPNIMDLLVALSAGFLGAYVKIRKPLATSFPGVAISISLMPPLCVTGIGFALGRPNVYIGSSLLFLTNFVCIIFSALLAFWIVDFKHVPKKFKALLWPAICSVLLCIPLLFNFIALVEESQIKREVRYLLKSKTHTFQAVSINKVEVDSFKKPIVVTVFVNTVEPVMNANQVHLVKEYLSNKIGKPINLMVNFSPVIQVSDME